MSGIKHIYEAWAERTISEEVGRGVIHYYLVSASPTPSTSASSLLAVVGTERSGRHYVYVVSENFLMEFGSSPAINAQTKWTSRSRVMEWLKSLVRKDNLTPTNSNLHNISAHKGDGSLDAISKPSGVQEPSGAHLPKPMEPTPREQASFKNGDNIEFLSKDVDMHDFWYRCKILKMCKRFWEVQCNDRKNEVGSGTSERGHCVPLPRLAPPDDNLSMRLAGRLTIRPCPPEEEGPATFEVGAAVDVWWGDGWWEGFVFTMESLSCPDNYYVFLPGRGKFLTVHRKDLRASRDWVDGKWVPIKSHPDILSFVLSYHDKQSQLSN